MAPKTNSFGGGAPHVPVDTYIDHELGLRRSGNWSYHAHVEEVEQHAGEVPVYQVRKIKADKKAIENLKTLQANRPLKPPGRK